VGDVSGMIAAPIAITHMTIILTIAFIMITIFQRLNSTTTASAATWLVFQEPVEAAAFSSLADSDIFLQVCCWTLSSLVMVA
jgi:hypothetical protein